MNDNFANQNGAANAALIRLDIWLWAARFFKTRSLAKKAIENSKIRLNGGAVRASTSVRVGDVLSIERGEERFEIAILAIIARRGSAVIAQQCYAETNESRMAREEAAELRRMTRNGYEKPPTKPDKRARRLIKALGDIDMY